MFKFLETEFKILNIIEINKIVQIKLIYYIKNIIIFVKLTKSFTYMFIVLSCESKMNHFKNVIYKLFTYLFSLILFFYF